MVGELSLMEHIDKLSIDMGQSSPTGYKTTLSIWAMDCKEWLEYFIKARGFGGAIIHKAVQEVDSSLGFSFIEFMEEAIQDLTGNAEDIKIEVTDNLVKYTEGESAVIEMIELCVLDESDGVILHDVSRIISLYTTYLLEIIETELTENA